VSGYALIQAQGGSQSSKLSEIRYMPLAEGNKSSPYEIPDHRMDGGGVSARDTRLTREVAIKVRPETFPADLTRMARRQGQRPHWDRDQRR